MFLPDVNVWLALTFESHFHHESAKTWFDQLAPGEAAFCRLTELGFLRLATNPAAFAEEAASLRQAWQLLDAFQEDDRVLSVAEPTDMRDLWRRYTSTEQFSPKIWNDAYLAAFAAAGRMRVATFDQAFLQFAETDSIILGE